MVAPGRLITFEGGEGAGKSTQVTRLAATLRAAGLAVVTTREPGGTPGAEAIRTLLVEGSPTRWLPLTETLLLLAARHDHVTRAIAPARAAGTWVVCDRFTDSTRVYQGMAAELGRAAVDRLQVQVLGDLGPDLTLILDVPVALGLGRRHAATGANRFEHKATSFHEQVRAGFLAVAEAEPERCVVIDGTLPASQVAEAVRRAVADRFAIDLLAAAAPGR